MHLKFTFDGREKHNSASNYRKLATLDIVIDLSEVENQ